MLRSFMSVQWNTSLHRLGIGSDSHPKEVKRLEPGSMLTESASVFSMN